MPDFLSCFNTDGIFVADFYPGLRSSLRATKIKSLQDFFKILLNRSDNWHNL